MESVDLIFDEGINWSAFLNSFNHLKSENDHNLLVESIKQSDQIMMIGIKTSRNKEEIESSFWQLYRSIIDNQIKFLEEQLKFNQQQNNNLIKIIEVMAEKENTLTLQGAHFAGGFASRDYTGDIITYNQGDKSHGDIVHNHGDIAYKETIKELQHFINRLSSDS
ncbi:hypothetical protein ACN4EE_12735 [Geminocystis sp. CENA526]|uniref:hypothetical protein n=1 Tax=Geminocystis sp. CENA526 TaxID=1355871 RepID=UPI003D6DAB99